MQKKARKLELHRETLKPLSDATSVQGGATIQNPCGGPVTASCSACVSLCNGRCYTSPVYCAVE